MEEQTPDLKAMLDQVDQEVKAEQVLSSLRLMVVLIRGVLQEIQNNEAQRH